MTCMFGTISSATKLHLKAVPFIFLKRYNWFQRYLEDRVFVMKFHLGSSVTLFTRTSHQLEPLEQELRAL